jgi:signal transduction histidine kinase
MSQNNQLLIVDDEAPQMKALCSTLQDHGFVTTGFTSAPAALEALKSQRFDLLLSDLMMPEMDGIAFLRAAQQQDPDLVGIIMTGAGTIATAVGAMKAGALDYILKPFRISDILPVLSRALEMRRLRTENARLDRQVREHAAALEAVNQELEAFTYSASHDLRAPLRRIDQFGAILVEDHAGALPQEGQELIARIRSNTTRMTQLIDDLLMLSRAGRAPLAVTRVDLSAEAAQVIANLRQAEPTRQVEVTIAPGLAAEGDQGLLRVILDNLLGNAWKYSGTRAVAHLIFDLQQTDRGPAFRVSDDGAGFDMAYVDKLFAPFQRLHREQEFPGSGIGLSIVARIIRRHGGSIWAEGKVGVGASFYFTIAARVVP